MGLLSDRYSFNFVLALLYHLTREPELFFLFLSILLYLNVIVFVLYTYSMDYFGVKISLYG